MVAIPPNIAQVKYSVSVIRMEAFGQLMATSKLQAPISAPHYGETQACCQFSQWTGVTEGQTTSLIQGGIAWSGFHQPKLPASNVGGFSLFVEFVPSSTNRGSGPVFLSPPSWMNGVLNQIIGVSTQIAANCAGGDLWYQFWKVGSSQTSQSIKCANTGIEDTAWYIFETPTSSTCNTGGYAGTCQIPAFSPTLTQTGNICESTCRNINSNTNPIAAFFISHNSADTATSAIPGNGNSWAESYLSSV